MTTGEVHNVSLDIGALSNGVRPIFKIPAGFGGVSVVSANVVGSAAGTSSLHLVDLGTAGTATAGTIATLGSSVYVAGVPKAFTVATAYVAEGHWVGVLETNVGAAPAITIVDVAYLMGK
jgi:hypothetical protein